MNRLRWISAYLVTAGVGLSLAYVLSLRFMNKAEAQKPPAASAPSDGALPEEFMKEIEAPKNPSAPSGAPAAAAPAPKAAAPANPSALPPAPAPTPAPGPVPPAASAGTSVGQEEYVYDPAGRRDPFHPYRLIRERKSVANPNPQSDTLEPLQRYDLEQLTVMGIMWDVRQPRALLKDSDGNLHTIVKSTKLGRSNGYVAAIREGEIVVVELVDDEGRTLKRTKIMEFKK